MHINHKNRIVAGLAGAALVAVVIAATATAGSASPVFAKAKLLNASGQAVGDVRFSRDHGAVTARAKVVLPVDSAEFHGFHIHANDPDPATGIRPGCDPATAFTSVGGHWDISGHTHGAHTGDLPSLIRQGDGEVELTFDVDKFTADQLVGHAIVVHVGPDNFGNVPLGTALNQYTDNGTAYTPTPGTPATGNAGARFACGVIDQH
jgi:Cu-Zn family superoxide dismutase